MATILETLINNWALLVMADRRDIEEVPEVMVIGGLSYDLRELVIEEINKRNNTPE